MKCLSCVETTARLHLYVDRELGIEEIAVVQRCECRFHFDLSLKRLIHERCTIQSAPEHLRQAVLRIAQAPQGTFLAIDPEIEMEIRADLESH